MHFTTIFFIDLFLQKHGKHTIFTDELLQIFHSLKENSVSCFFFTRDESIRNLYPSLPLLHITSCQEQWLFLQNYTPINTLVISDDSQFLCECKSIGCSCLGFSHTGEFLPVTYCFEEISSLTFSYLEYVHRRCQHMPVTIIDTETLLIREFTKEDIPSLFELYQQRTELSCIHQQGQDYPVFYEKFCSYIEKVYPFYDFGLWAVILKETEQLIGKFGLQCSQIADREEIELGYIIHKDFRGKGYACEVIRKIFCYAKDTLSLNRIVAVIHPKNQVSIHVARKCGMHFEKEILSHGQFFHLYVIFLKNEE